MRKTGLGMWLGIGTVVCMLGGISWLLTIIFESETPRIQFEVPSEYLSLNQKYNLTVNDSIRGLRILTVSVHQDGREVTVLEENFPYKGWLNREGTHHYEKEFTIDHRAFNLAQGDADLKVSVRDYSRRGGGDGNLGLVQHKMIVDTIPPNIRAVSRMHNVRVGGTGLVVYQTSLDTAESGVFLNDLFFKGFPAGQGYPEGFHVCYFAIPNTADPKSKLSLWAKDKAGNEAKGSFYNHLRGKRFKSDTLNITDGFLSRVIPYFVSHSFGEASGSDVEKYIEVNRILRKKNEETLYHLRMDTVVEKLWEGEWLRMKNAAPMAGFGDRRSYFYKGQKIDEQIHLGVDLASLANSEVQAANHGRVIFSDHLGIYGLTVVLDHGQGLASSYSHLSKTNVSPGQTVARGEVIGLTGQTGLAGGDHLHFGIFVHGIPVDPVEWWDPHWIENNVTGKLSSVRKEE
jgi:hypothetical protein